MRPRILLSPNLHGWCFERIALQLQRHLSDEFDINIRLAGDAVEQGGDFDVAVALWWRNGRFLRRVARRLVLCVYDEQSWRPQPHQPAAVFQRELAAADVVAVASQRIAALLPGAAVRVIEDGVDTESFVTLPLPETFTAGWAGDSAAGAGDTKGVGIIRRACELAGVPLVVADRRVAPVPHEAMPAWYGGISVYLCASVSEGTPNPVLEALACGRPVISTDVGIVRRAVDDGVTGRIVDRHPEAIADALVSLRGRDLAEMSRAARRAAEAWDWRHKAEAWRSCLRAALAVDERDRAAG